MSEKVTGAIVEKVYGSIPGNVEGNMSQDVLENVVEDVGENDVEKVEEKVEKKVEKKARLGDFFRNLKLSKKKLLISLVVSTSVILCGYVFSVAYGVFISEKIYYGVTVSGIDVGGLSREDARTLIKKNFTDNISLKYITLKAKEESEKISYDKAKVTYDCDKAIDLAYEYGRDSSLINQFVNQSFMRNPAINIEVNYSYDKKYVSNIVETFVNKMHIEPKDYQMVIDPPNKVSIKTGHHGETLEKEETLKKIDDAIKSGKDVTLQLDLKIVKQKEVSLDDVFKKLNVEPKDASTEVVKNRIKIISESYGRKIEKSILNAIVPNINKREDYETVLPVNFIDADVKSEDVKGLLLRDELSGYSTQFYTGDQNNDNRKHNITLAASKLNEILVGAGRIFSFNDTVGPRTGKYGYKTAHSYVVGNIVDSVGGGICQVSTTLYNAVLLADLGVVERNNHIYTVAYVPKGRDAAVSYDDCDFKFKNTTKYPIKINCWVTEDNQITFSLMGTRQGPEKTYDFRYEIISEIEPPERKFYDALMPSGSREIIKEGMKGYIVNTYKIIRQEGKPDKEVFLGTSEYAALPKEVKIGTR